ncbi:MAG: prepilin-type N-terminal cleavage/methylation domain-containing protein [Candidatus Riflebacteria bacterium]|nr:prepilin-type N-terminal cleavage/methylation domain-containing protein [Candidatus Riflebacteria bacterium]
MKNRKGFTLIELMIVIAIIGILAAMAIPNFKKARASARQKACYSNIRVIQGAVEMYNMDVSSMMTGLSIEKLISGNYLKSTPSKPEVTCSYKGSSLDGNGSVYCGHHGDVEGNTEGAKI